jgi:serine/threonine protein kinase
MSKALKDECSLSFYKEICVLDEVKDVILVQNQFTNKVYVKKTIDVYNEDVYERLKNLNHKNIVKNPETFYLDDHLIVIEEFVNGDNMEDIIKDNKAIPDIKAVSLVLQICDGLEYMHNLKPPIIHRDIKLSNVMVTNDGVVKIIDFNTSRIYCEDNSKDTFIMGTEGYAPPEQFGFAQTDCRSDIYSLGILFNYLMTGKHPNFEEHRGQYKNVIKKCIDLSPDKRFKSIREFRKALKSRNFEVDKPKEKVVKGINIPGFRTSNPIKMAIATIGYIAIIFMAMSVESNGGDSFTGIIDRLVTLFVMLGWVALFTNYRNITQYFPLVNKKNPFLKILGYLISSVLIAIIIVLIAALFQP